MADSTPHTDTATFIKKKGKSRPGGLRQKPAELEEFTTSTPSTSLMSEVITASRKQTANHLIQGTGLSRKRKAEEAALMIDSDPESDTGKDTILIRHSASVQRPRRRSSSPPAEMSAQDIKTNAKVKVLDPTTGREAAEVIVDDGIYRGAAGNAHKLPKAFGPVKGGPGNVRTITVVDYQPDVCKDYKETGFCGFGDTCKFLHDRGDYLKGWELDNSFLSSNAAAGSFMAKQAARNAAGDGSDSDSENEDLPFACLICREPFGKEPVVTLCGHYFDSKCAIKRYGKTAKCFACGKPTNGVFNKATKLIAKQKEREKLAADASAAAAEEEEENGGAEIEGLTELDEQEHGSESRGDEEEEEEEEEAPKPVRRRPIIEIE